MIRNVSQKSANATKNKVKQVKLQESKPTIRFSAKLSQPSTKDKGGSWTLLELPKNASAKFPSQDMSVAEGTINGFPFRTAIEPDGCGSHWLRMSKALRDAAGADVGDMVTVEITRIGEEPECRVPTDLRKALEGNSSAQASWSNITPMARRDWVLSIISVKQEETRRHRIEITCDKLASGMRRPCCFPGINWRRKDSDVTSNETWVPLPSSKSRCPTKSATK